MKTIFLFGFFCMLTGFLLAQDGNDYIERNSYSIVKTSLDVKGGFLKSASSLRTSLDVENHCGSKYTKNRVYGEMTDSFYTEYRYPDGLILQIPEEEGGRLLFTVTSDSYALLLSSGTQIRIGMKADELQKIFPSSFMKRKPISDIRGKEGKISFIVNLASKIDNQTLKEDAWIRFIMNPDTGLLEEFYLYEPL